MFVAHHNHACRPVSVLLGGSGTSRIISQQRPDVGVLLRPHTMPDGSGSKLKPVLNSQWVVDHHD